MTTCKPKQLKLCGKEDCNICFERSFASYDDKTPLGKLKVECWDYEKNGDIKPINLSKGTNKKYWFKCDNCPHMFDSLLSNISKTNPTWCPYCNGNKLCGLLNCSKCTYKSLLKVDFKNKTWSKKNKEKPINISKSSDKMIYMDCCICKHELYIQAKTIKNGDTCKYCAHLGLCNNENCDFCYTNSFGSFKGKTKKGKLKVDCWDSDKNGDIKPRDINNGTHKKYWFRCDNCPHKFEKTICDLTGKKNTWCPYCCSDSIVIGVGDSRASKICEDNNCNYCLPKSLASYNGKTKKGNLKIKCLDKSINPRNINKGSGNKLLINCDSCPHTFEKVVKDMTGKNTWCPYCAKPSKVFCKEYINNYLDCNHCYEKSFDAHPKSKYLDKNKDKDIDFKYIICDVNIKYWFKCDKCEHSFDSKLPNIKTGHWCPYCSHNPILCDNDCKICFQKSFASCIEKTPSGNLKVECWNFEKNNKKPREVTLSSSSDKYWFNCDKCAHSFVKVLSSISKESEQPQWCPYCCIPTNELCKDIDCKICYNSSFESYKGTTKNGLLITQCYNKIKNKCSPRDIIKGSGKKYWFNCFDCKHELHLIISDVTSNNSWCGYCSTPVKHLCNKNECNFCYNNSFSSYDGKTSKEKLKVECWDYDKNGTIKPRDIIKGSGKKYWFNCDNCPHSFKTNINNNCWCPYCCNNSKILCNNECSICFNKSFASYDGKTSTGKLKVECWNKSKNGKNTPRNTSRYGDKRIFFDCDICNNTWDTQIKKISINRWCPICKNKTEKKFLQWLKDNFQYKIIYQSKYNWCKSPDTNSFLPFDFVIEELKLIIEVDGRQHFEQISNWNAPEDTFEHDEYKMKQAKNNGYSMIRIFQEDIYNDKNDWENKTKEVIKLYDEPTIITIGCEILYKNYNSINNMEELETEEKPHKCEKCNICFKFKSQLERHSKSELHITGKKKTRSDKKEEFKCPHCDLYTTKQKTNLKLHILNNHKTKEERKAEFSFYCVLCDSGTLKEAQHNKHLETKKHKKKLELSSK